MAAGPRNRASMKIAVKYCGGCNPAIDRANLVGKLALLVAEAHPEWKLVALNDGDYDALILINGCPVGCVQKQFLDEKRPVFLVAGESLQRQKVSERELAQALMEQILHRTILQAEAEECAANERNQTK